MILTYRYRLLPLKSQHRALEGVCAAQRELYNAALEERIDCYRKTGQTRTYIDQCKALRRHACASCGLAIDRDHNASLNILRAGIGAGALNVIGCR